MEPAARRPHVGTFLFMAKEYFSSQKACRPMLQSMQDPVVATNTAAPSSFASLLAALTTSAAESAGEDVKSSFADDVATLSYEQALRTQSHYRSRARGDFSPAQTKMSKILSDSPPPSQERKWRTQAGPAQRHTSVEKNRKAASVTIRISQDESEQLRQRAAEAGVTVSAYLRSCMFEVEALRTQVKDALAQIQSASAPAPRTASKMAASSTWRARLFPIWQGRRDGAQA